MANKGGHDPGRANSGTCGSLDPRTDMLYVWNVVGTWSDTVQVAGSQSRQG